MTNLISSFSEEITKLYREMLRGVKEDGTPSNNFTSYITHPSALTDKRTYIQIAKKLSDLYTNPSGYSGPMIRIHFIAGELETLGIGSEAYWRSNGTTFEVIFDTTQIEGKQEYWQIKWQNEILKTLAFNMPKMKELICFINVSLPIDNLNDTDEFKKRINVIHDLIVENG